MSEINRRCPDRDDSGAQSRREFLKNAAAVSAAAASISLLGPTPLRANEAAARKSETLVSQLFGSLSEEQKRSCTFAFEDPLRWRVDANWQITKPRIGKDFNADQQALLREIFLQLHSEEYRDAVWKQVEHDGGFGNCSIAIFGQPGTGASEFVLTGRHVTRRCDGDSVKGAAFGGPIFYGHAAEAFNETAEHPGNVYWYQAKRANELFQALDGKQRQVALQAEPRKEQGTDTVKFADKPSELVGLPVAEMSADQKELARKVMHDVLAPFREVDRVESMELVEKNGFDALHFSYYKNLDIGNDGVWDVWQIEGPAMVWHFRGAPHVHTWVHIRDSA